MQFSVSNSSTIAIMVVNAVLTFAFGYQFAGALLPDVPPYLAPFITGFLYLAVFDAGAAGWNAKAELPGLSERQYQIADGVATVCTYSSSIISAAHIFLSIDLPFLPETVQHTASLVATIATVFIVGVHFISLRQFILKDPSRIENQVHGLIASRVNTAKLKHYQRVQLAAIASVSEYAEEHTDDLKAQFASDLMDQFQAPRKKKEPTTGRGKKTPPSGRAKAAAKAKTAAAARAKAKAKAKAKAEAEAEAEVKAAEENYIEYEELGRNGAHHLNLAG